MPGLHCLHALPHGFAGEFAQFLSDRLCDPLPAFLFTDGNPDC